MNAVPKAASVVRGCRVLDTNCNVPMPYPGSVLRVRLDPDKKVLAGAPHGRSLRADLNLK